MIEEEQPVVPGAPSEVDDVRTNWECSESGSGRSGSSPGDRNPGQPRSPQRGRGRRRRGLDDAPVDTPATRTLCESVAHETGGVCFLGFSRGKDSIAAWLFLRQFFARIIPFHCASIPHLRFVDDSLAYYEDFFQTPILRLMDGAIFKAFAEELVYQPLDREPEIEEINLGSYEKWFLVDFLRVKYHIPQAWVAYGISLTDSINRRARLTGTKGRMSKKKVFYPCYDWPYSMIMDRVRRSGVKLPADYRMANRSLAGVPRFRHLDRMREAAPDDFELVKVMFPLIEGELARVEFRRERLAREAQRGRDGPQAELPSAVDGEGQGDDLVQ